MLFEPVLIIHVPLWMASASLSGISMLNSSSIAITTSTVSRESNPRSFAKCAWPEIWTEVSGKDATAVVLRKIVPSLDPRPAHMLMSGRAALFLLVTYLVKVLQQIHNSSLHLFPRQASRSRIKSYARDEQ